MVRTGKQSLRHFNPQRLGCLKIDSQFVLCWRLYWKIGGLFTFKDAIDVACRAAVLVEEIRPIGDQATLGDEVAFVIDRRQLVVGREADDQRAMNLRQPARRHDEAAIRSACESSDGALDLGSVARADCA